MNLRSFALTAVAAGALGLAGCGGDDSPSTAKGGADNSGASAQELLTKTFGASSAKEAIKSGTLEFKIGGKFTGEGAGSGDASFKVSVDETPKGAALPPFNAEVAVNGKEENGGSLDIKAGATYVDDRFYIAYDGDNYDVGEELSKRAVEEFKKSSELNGATTEAEQKELLAKLGLQPETWLKDPKLDGEEKIGDVDTYKITGDVDIKAMVPDLLDAAREAQKLAPGAAAGAGDIPEVSDADLAKAEKQIEKLTVTIWTGKDDTILRQMEVDTAIKGEGADANEKIEGQLSFTLTDLNKAQKIEAPTETKPITDLMPKLSGLLGAAGGLGAGAATSGADTSGAGSSAVSDAYIECVQSAAGDAAKLNECQAELQK